LAGPIPSRPTGADLKPPFALLLWMSVLYFKAALDMQYPDVQNWPTAFPAVVSKACEHNGTTPHS
jgi:hypothetical protein